MDKISQVKNEYRHQKWTELIRQRQESGMTVVGFCEANGLNSKTYYYWLRKLREEVCKQAVVAIPMMPEELEEAAGKTTVRVRTRNLVVEIENGASAATIEAVVSALQERC